MENKLVFVTLCICTAMCTALPQHKVNPQHRVERLQQTPFVGSTVFPPFEHDKMPEPQHYKLPAEFNDLESILQEGEAMQRNFLQAETAEKTRSDEDPSPQGDWGEWSIWDTCGCVFVFPGGDWTFPSCNASATKHLQVDRLFMVEWAFFPTFDGLPNPMVSYALTPLEAAAWDKSMKRQQLPAGASAWTKFWNKVSNWFWDKLKFIKLLGKVSLKGIICTIKQAWWGFKQFLIAMKDAFKSGLAALAKLPANIANGWLKLWGRYGNMVDCSKLKQVNKCKHHEADHSCLQRCTKSVMHYYQCEQKKGSCQNSGTVTGGAAQCLPDTCLSPGQAEKLTDCSDFEYVSSCRKQQTGSCETSCSTGTFRSAYPCQMHEKCGSAKNGMKCTKNTCKKGQKGKQQKAKTKTKTKTKTKKKKASFLEAASSIHQTLMNQEGTTMNEAVATEARAFVNLRDTLRAMSEEEFQNKLMTLEHEFMSMKTLTNVIRSTASTLHKLHMQSQVTKGPICTSDETFLRGSLQVVVNFENPSFWPAMVNLAAGNIPGAIANLIPEILVGVVPLKLKGKPDTDKSGYPQGCSGKAAEERLEEILEQNEAAATIAIKTPETVEAGNGQGPNDDPMESLRKEMEASFLQTASQIEFEAEMENAQVQNHKIQAAFESSGAPLTGEELNSFSLGETEAILRADREFGEFKQRAKGDQISFFLDYCNCQYMDSWRNPLSHEFFEKACGKIKDEDAVMIVDRVFTVEYLVFPTFTIFEPNPMLTYAFTPGEKFWGTKIMEKAAILQAGQNAVVSKLAETEDLVEDKKTTWDKVFNFMKKGVSKILSTIWDLLKIVLKGAACVLYQAWGELVAAVKKMWAFTKHLKEQLVKAGKWVASGAKKLWGWVAKKFRPKGGKSKGFLELDSYAVNRLADMDEHQLNTHLKAMSRHVMSGEAAHTIAHRTFRRVIRMAHSAEAQGAISFFRECCSIDSIRKGTVNVALNIEFPSFGPALRRLLAGDIGGALDKIIPELLIAFTPMKVMTGQSVVRFDKACYATKQSKESIEMQVKDGTKVMEDVSQVAEQQIERHEQGLKEREQRPETMGTKFTIVKSTCVHMSDLTGKDELRLFISEDHQPPKKIEWSAKTGDVKDLKIKITCETECSVNLLEVDTLSKNDDLGVVKVNPGDGPKTYHMKNGKTHYTLEVIPTK